MLGLREREIFEVLDASPEMKMRTRCIDGVLSRRIGVDVASLPIGQRDAALVELRLRSFGPRIEVRAACPACSEELVAELDLGTLPLHRELITEIVVATGGREFRVRLPTTVDLDAVAEAPSPHEALIGRCVTVPGETASGSLDDSALQAIEEAIEAADPLVDISLNLACPDCGHGFSKRFDIGEQLWAEIENYGRRLTLEVHWLASRYGWTEPEVLALSPARRRAYLELGAS
jgi:hypothetical protein